MPAYVPPHKRGAAAATNSASAGPARDVQRPPARTNVRTDPPHRDRGNTRGDPTRGDPTRGSRPPPANSRFQGVFSSYDQPPRRNQYGGYTGGYGNNRRNNGGYGRGRRGGGRATRELSLIPDPGLERELFGAEDRTTQGINFARYDDIPVEMSGDGAPEGLESFEKSSLHATLVQNITKCGYTVPTPVQKFSIPIVCTRRDLMGCAQTGSGKTAAFLLPIINNLLCQESLVTQDAQNRRRSRYYPRALILSPTRELSQQIYQEARKFLYCTGMRAVCIYGGSPIGDQFRELDGGVHVLVATPGRLWDMLERGRMSLSHCEYLCLDEADRMLDMGFEPQIRNIVEGKDMMTRQEGRNTLMFSATFPDEIQQLAQDFLSDYIFLAVGRVGSTTDLITQTLRQVDEHDKVDTLIDLLPEIQGLKLVFTATKRCADKLEYILNENGFSAISIHGDKTQREREYALRSFRNQKVETLVATDVAARGLDIPNVAYVLQYDLPATIDDYVHRIGRTGRCGNTGIALSFVNYNNSNVFQDLLHILEEAEQEVPTWFNSMARNSYRGRKKKKGRYGGRDARNKYNSRRYNGKTGGSWGDRGGDRDRPRQRRGDAW